MLDIPPPSSFSLPTLIFFKKRRKRKQLTNQITTTKTKLGLSLVLGSCRWPWECACTQSPQMSRLCLCRLWLHQSFPAGRVLTACWRHLALSMTAQGCNELEFMSLLCSVPFHPRSPVGSPVGRSAQAFAQDAASAWAGRLTGSLKVHWWISSPILLG